MDTQTCHDWRSLFEWINEPLQPWGCCSPDVVTQYKGSCGGKLPQWDSRQLAWLVHCHDLSTIFGGEDHGKTTATEEKNRLYTQSMSGFPLSFPLIREANMDIHEPKSQHVQVPNIIQSLPSPRRSRQSHLPRSSVEKSGRKPYTSWQGRRFHLPPGRPQGMRINRVKLEHRDRKGESQSFTALRVCFFAGGWLILVNVFGGSLRQNIRRAHEIGILPKQVGNN